MLTRRAFGQTMLATGLVAATPGLARAPLAETQVPGIYRRKIGDIEITALLDGYVPLSSDLFSGVPSDEMAAILASAGLTKDLPTAVNAFVINTPAATYLVDTGIGASQAFGPTLGNMAKNLAAAGISPDQIDAVILTHAHADHAEGLVDATGAAIFANAELVLHEAELAFWTDDGVLAQAPEAMKPFFESARKSIGPYAARTRPVSGGEIFPGIALMHAPGHTPGHSVLRLTSGDAALLILGDTFHNAAIHFAEPDAGFGFDNDPAMAAASRRKLFDMAAADGILTAATHVSFPGFGRVLAEGDHFRYLPAEWAYPL